MTRIVDVLLPLPIDQLFSYAIEKDTEVSIGDYVVVPFGRKRLIGIVWKYSGKSDRELKCIEQKIELPSIRPKLIEFAEWVVQYNVIPIGMLAKVIMGGVLKVNQIDKLVFTKQKQEISEIDCQLSPEQQAARDKIISNLNEYSVTLLDGETGSGKTEVYLSVIARLIEIVNDAQVLILLPEIVLTSQLVNRVHSQISGNIAEWHSGLTPKARRNNWLSIANGSAQIIIGARSALFLPYKNLKLIIIDEEHDSSFKQEQGIIYNARDMAIILAKLENISIILSSATPLLETIYHVKKGNYNHVKLTKRFGGAELPQIKVVNNKQWISNELFEGIKQTIEKKQQVMLFLNRRGYAQLAVCKKCGYKISCSNCTVWLTYHKKKNVLLCHHCSYQSKLPEKCSNCQSEQSLLLYGVGIERLVEEIVKLIPNAKTAIISSDQKSLGSVIDSVLKEEVNIIIGTQVIAKGHNFPKLTLVGVINADLGLENYDLRAAEKTYQLLHQVAGRSGRFNEKGTVIVQTNNPESLIIKALQQQKRDLFYEIELESRRKAKMPPFSRLIALIVCGKDQFATQKAANEITNFLHNQFSTTSQHLKLKEFEIFGPSPAAINFLNNKYRYRVLLKIHNKYSLSIKKKLKHCCNLSSNIAITIDVDPVSFF
ncbi:replication restart helicase PriA [Wolbachia endosymbiont of Frankliniella intonsa]|uniref:replication restart helicase PriA n=1 Tax=Wolbachia endosymbiont of Frankliniella intonsa TaxID=2902422 RepID=UPI00244EA41C|nr:primosomal protein N' [Wolbachia endosymbiont of Frankliniella intonsa]WGJ62354.1 primosomal protein N' [Wolbachia endosymbiont of Frankliniella intonsa]